MSPRHFEIRHNEWLMLGMAVMAAEADLTGIVPTLDRGSAAVWYRDHWTVRGLDGTVVAVEHRAAVDDDEDLNIGLPVELVQHAVVLVNTGEKCDLMVDGADYVGVRAESGSVAIADAGEQIPISIQLDVEPSASGTATAIDLWRAIGGAGQVPGHVDPDYRPPVMQVGIEDGSIGFSTDWRRYGHTRSTYRAPATTTDGTGMAGLSPATITRLLHRTAERREDIEVEVGICADCVVFDTLDTGGGWRAWVPLRPVGALEYGEEVEAALNGAGLEWSWSGAGQITVEAADKTSNAVEVGFFDTWPETLRLSTVVTDGLKESIEVHRALASLNANKVGLRFWFEKGHVIAAHDLPCYRHNEFAAAIRHLWSETEGLGILLQSTNNVGGETVVLTGGPRAGSEEGGGRE